MLQGTDQRVCQCGKTVSGRDAILKQNSDGTREYVFCVDCNPILERGRGSAVTFAELSRAWINTTPGPDRPVGIPDGNGFRYEWNGRPYICSNRCELCGEFGVFADTQLCPDCDQVVREAREEGFQAGYHAAKRPLTAEEEARVTVLAALLEEVI